jgi:UDP-galactopyranose mutase
MLTRSRDEDAGRSPIIKNGNSSSERVEEFTYLGTTLTYQSSIQEEITSSLKAGNACYYSVQNLLSSSLLSKNLKIEVYRTINLPVFCMGVNLVARIKGGT